MLKPSNKPYTSTLTAIKKNYVLINKIYIIESLRPADELTGKELYDDIIKRYISFYQKDISHNYTFTQSKNDFINKLNDILEHTKNEDEIIIHIEAHGGNEVMQFGNDELLKWTELEKHLIKINLACKNKLHLNLATCYGMHIAEKITLTDTAPYKSYISALNELSPAEIIEDNSILYKSIIESQNIFSSYVEFFKQKPNTQLRIKDIETAMEMIVGYHISLFTNNISILKDFFEPYLNIQIDNLALGKLKTKDEIVEYVLNLFLSRYLPK